MLAPKFAKQQDFFSGSAGGIIAGNLVAQWPDIFRVIIIQSGILNLSRVWVTSTGDSNESEFGKFSDPEDQKAMVDNDAFLNLKTK